MAHVSGQSWGQAALTTVVTGILGLTRLAEKLVYGPDFAELAACDVSTFVTAFNTTIKKEEKP
jgi:hypothetical protein